MYRLFTPLLCLPFLILVFIHAPLQVLYENMYEIGAPYFAHFLKPYLIGFAVSMAAVLLFSYMVTARFAIKIGTALFAVYVLIIQFGIFYYISGIVEELLWTVLVVLAIIGVIYTIKKRPAYSVKLAIILLSVQIFQVTNLVSSLYDIKFSRENSIVEDHTLIASQAGARNKRVFHIILDGFQAEIFNNNLESHPNIKSDFVRFTNAKSQYWQTHFSFPSFLKGGHYDGVVQIKDWAYYDFFKDSIHQFLANKGVALHQMVYYNYMCFEPQKNKCVVQKDFENIELGTATFFDLWFNKIVPTDLMKRFVRVDSYNVFNNSISIFSPSKYLSIGKVSVKPKDSAPMTVELFGNFLQSIEKNSRDSNHYYFMHLMVPHPSYVLDRNCSYIQTDHQQNVQAYQNQSDCALHLVDRLISRLKSLNIYDDSFIFVHSDHGMGVRDINGKYEFESVLRETEKLQEPSRHDGPIDGYSNGMINSFANVPLVIKFPGSLNGGITVDKAVPLTLVKSTVLSAFGYKPVNASSLMNFKDLRFADAFRIHHYAYNHKYHHSIPKEFADYQLTENGWLKIGNINVIGEP